MRNPGPDNTLSSTEIESLRSLETVLQRSFTEVGEALTEIRDAQLYRDTHATFEAYLRERWDIDTAVPVHSDGSGLIGALLPQLRWLLTQSAGTIADVAHQLETHPFDLDDRARQQLRDDVLVVEEELATLKMLLADVDWDAEFQGLLDVQNSPPESDARR